MQMMSNYKCVCKSYTAKSSATSILHRFKFSFVLKRIAPQSVTPLHRDHSYEICGLERNGRTFSPRHVIHDLVSNNSIVTYASFDRKFLSDFSRVTFRNMRTKTVLVLLTDLTLFRISPLTTPF